MSILTIDVGNTRLKWAIFATTEPDQKPLASGAVVHEAIDDLASQDWRGLKAPAAMIGCIVAGEAVKRRVEDQLQMAWNLQANWIVPLAEQCGVTNGYDFPSRLGADRWAAILGARLQFGDQPTVVVMVGTAVTVEAMTAEGLFLGGLIMPGFGLMLDALESGTAGLRVYAGEVLDFPTNTSDALMSGGANAIAGAVERMVQKLQRYCGATPKVVVTGGAASKLTPSLGIPHEVNDQLIFNGLLQIAKSNQANSVSG